MDAYDLGALFEHREVLGSLDPDGPPAVAMLGRTRSPSRIAVLPGSFNPPTAAHLLLAERALGDSFDLVLFLLARTTVGKLPSGLIPEDRLLALRMIAQSPSMAVGVSSAGLYCDQAEAIADAFPRAEVSFLVGSDKVVQIFEDRWYDDREDSLRRLFSHASLVVSPRADGGELVRRTVEDRRNSEYASQVSTLALHPAVSDLSSTRVRGLLQSGADSTGLVPARVAEFLAEVKAFAGPASAGEYVIRARLVDGLWRERDWAIERADLKRLCAVASSRTFDGERIRSALEAGTATTEDFERAQSSAVRG